jgi:rod shape-determining protein MreD
VNPFTALRIGLVVFVASIFQVSALSSVEVLNAAPDLLLVTVVAIALLRGSIPGAVAGFLGGLLVDLVTMSTLGVTSLLLTAAGYWAGRYGETTGRGRPQAPLVAVAAITMLVGLGAYGLHFMLGDTVSAQLTLVPLLPALVWNALLAYPVHRLLLRVVGTGEGLERPREVEIVA